MIVLFKKYSFKWTIVAVILMLLVGCVGLTSSKENENENTHTIADTDINIDKLLEYKDSYVGDNSAVGNILSLLPGVSIKQFSLQTSNPPYGIQVDYGLKEQSSLTEEDFNAYWTNENMKKIFLNNATTLFILVKNVDEVKFNVDTPNNPSFNITRKELETFYGKDLREYAEDKSLWEKEILEDTLNSSERLEYFLKTYSTIAAKNNTVNKDNDKDIKEINLYFADDNAEYLVAEVRKIENPTPKKVIQEIIKGPFEPNLYGTMPEKTEIIDVEIKDNIAYVNFTKNLEEALNGNYGSSAASRLLIYSIVNTLTLYDEFQIEEVQFLIEGNNQVSLGPFGIVDLFSENIEMIKSENIVITFYDYDADDYENPSNLKEFSIPSKKYKNNMAEVLNDIFSQIGITINSITSKEDGKYIIVDITEDTVNNFDRGSTAGIILTNEFIMTLLNLPNVEKVEVTVEGKKGCEGNHYSFNGIFVKDKDFYKLIY